MTFSDFPQIPKTAPINSKITTCQLKNPQNVAHHRITGITKAKIARRYNRNP